MPYYMCPSYGRKQQLPTDDLLEAVKISINYEADLFIGGYLLASWLGYSMEENIERLKKEGIETYVVENNYRFRYYDDSKNIKRIYFRMHDFENGTAEIHLKSTPSKLGDPCYSSIDEVYNIIKESHPSIRTLTVVDFSGDKYTGSYEHELYAVVN